MANAPRRNRRIPRPGLYANQRLVLCTPEELRNLFREARILQRERQGQLTKTVEKRGEFNVQLDGEPESVRTVITVFRTLQNSEVARTHHYERRDGSIAASGELDPKRLMWNGALHYVESH